ncbi:MAG: hypothetical protein ACTSWD_04870 [Candidatus Heimdallarchaeota archaeon]
MNKCPTCGKDCKATYCNQRCYANSEQLKNQARNSRLIKTNSENKWHKGHSHSEETKKLISEKTPKRFGKDNNSWKGEDVGYDALHDWVKRHKLPFKICQVCGKTRCRIEAANISGDYKRDVSDFIWLCCSCHTRFDNIKKMNLYEVIGVESKLDGELDKTEKEKCKWLLDHNIFSKILIAEKTKVKNKVVIVYHDFKEKYWRFYK